MGFISPSIPFSERRNTMKNQIHIPADVATIEISSSCNAKCRWCTTGLKNRICPAMPEYMAPELFERGLNRLFQLGWINDETKIELHNWGEPFLHPKLDEILRILTENGLRFYLSTNGSIYRKLPTKALKNMERLTISIPGMSKDSYEKIHRLDMETVQENIRKFSADLKAAGVGERLFITFQVYQFNLSELSSARRFAEELGAAFTPNTAYFNDYRITQSFLTGTMQKDELYEAAAQLFLHGYQKSGSVEETHCRLWDQVCFDHAFNLVPCNRLTANERLGNLFDDRSEDLIDGRICYKECKNCIESGQCKSIVEGGLQEDWNLYGRHSTSRAARFGELKAQNRALNVMAEAQRARIEQLEAQNRAIQESFDIISNAFFWKITKPARWTLDSLKRRIYSVKT